ncbi:MAG: hypothetical protein KDA90_11070 [Planctomycetaceae bacterium]|nr:hypothetical protein [Planctomycetaceae bacterium]
MDQVPKWGTNVLNGSLIWGDPSWLWPAAGIVLLLAAGLLLSYRGVRRPIAWKVSLSGLKLLAAILIALCLLNPLWSQTRPRSGENVVALLADNSASLTIRSSSGPRRDQLTEQLQDPNLPWQVRLAQEFNVQHFLTGERTSPCEDFSQLDFTAPSSMLVSGLQSVEERFASQPLAAILLFTDGNATDADVLAGLNLQVPVFPVLPDADDNDVVDLTISNVSVSQTPFEDAPITVQASIGSTGLANAAFVARIQPHKQAGTTPDNAESRSQEQRLVLDAQGRCQVRFELNPKDVGTLFYDLSVRLEDQPGQTGDNREVTLENNARLLVMERRAAPYRVLYIAGRPNWEHKFLTRSVADDHQLDLVSLIRIAKKEAKFDFRGRAGERGNSLFRGFKDGVDEEAGTYDQPVLIRLNTRDEAELRDGFPQTRKDLFAYDALILDDIEGAFFTHDQQVLIDRFVSERGGGLLMLGGLDTFRNGDWDKTSVRDALPVYLDRQAEKPATSVRLRLTRDGWLQPWVRLRSTEAAENQRLSAARDLRTLTTIAHIKPAARTLAEVVDESGTAFPALVIQQYGKGQSGAVLPGDLWRWGLHPTEAKATEDLGKAWRQTLRWLVSETPQRISVESVPLEDERHARLIRVRLKGPEYEPLDNAAVRLTLQTPAGEAVPYDAEPSLAEAGLFEVIVIARETGPYRVDVTATAGDSEPEILTASTGWANAPLFDEFASTSINRDLMEAVARKSGGRVLSISDLPPFVESLQHREMPMMETETYPLWHSPWLLLLALACLVAEWGLRRTRGLA